MNSTGHSIVMGSISLFSDISYSIPIKKTFYEITPHTTLHDFSSSVFQSDKNGRLQYTGPPEMFYHVIINVSLYITPDVPWTKTINSEGIVLLQLFKNNSPEVGVSTHIHSNLNDPPVMGASCSGIVSLNTDDYLSVYIKDDDYVNDIPQIVFVNNYNLTVVRIF